MGWADTLLSPVKDQMLVGLACGFCLVRELLVKNINRCGNFSTLIAATSREDQRYGWDRDWGVSCPSSLYFSLLRQRKVTKERRPFGKSLRVPKG